MEMKIKLAAVLSIALVSAAFAHDEGHGPKLTDSPQQGGVIAPVVLASEAKLGPKAALVYKAELVRLDDGTVQVYLYNQDMKPLSLSNFAETGKANVEVSKRGKMSYTPYPLKREVERFSGKITPPATKPFNIDVTVQEKDRKLLAAFDNLD
jgi:hypothetical protein